MTRLVQIRTNSSAPDAGARLSVDADPAAHPAGPRVYVETLGCQMNEADSALIVGQLSARGYVRVGDPAAADVILLNTCAVREKAEERVYGRTSQLLRHKKDKVFDTVCMFFDQKARRCTVYESRPGVCRAYPDSKHCGYYDFLKFERAHQADPDFIALT